MDMEGARMCALIVWSVQDEVHGRHLYRPTSGGSFGMHVYRALVDAVIFCTGDTHEILEPPSLVTVTIQ